MYHPFAWVAMVADGLMGLSFAFMSVVTMYRRGFRTTSRLRPGRTA
jgi:hypothetical protein